MTKSEINELYEGSVDKIYKFFYFKLQDVDVAQDLTSQTFLDFVKKAATKNDIDEPIKYLYGIAKLTFLKHLRKKYVDKAFIRMDVGEFGAYVDDYVEEVEEHATIEEYAQPYIDQLPDKQRTIAQMRFIEKKELPEICEAIGKDMNYVKTTQKRAMHSLRKMIATDL